MSTTQSWPTPTSEEEIPLSTELLGGSLAKRIAHTKKPPLVGYPYLNFFTTDEERRDAEAFLRRRPLAMEIGFGRGHFITELARQRPDDAFVAFEIRRKWCQWLAKRMDRLGLTNIRVGQQDARSLIVRGIPDHSVSELYVNFPDPWWKKRHQKRRLFSAEFLTLMHRKLVPSGRIFLKTDVEPYAQRAQEAFAAHDAYHVGPIVPGSELELPLSYREKRYARLGTPTYGVVAVAREGSF